MEKKNANDDGKKATNSPNSPVGRHSKPLFKQDGWTSHDGCGEEDIINRCNYRSVEDVKGFIKVAYLDADADHKAYEKGPEQRLFQNGRSSNQLFDPNAKAFHTGHRQRTNHRADEDVHQHILLTVVRCDKEDQGQAADHNADSKSDESCETCKRDDYNEKQLRAHSMPSVFVN